MFLIRDVLHLEHGDSAALCMCCELGTRGSRFILTMSQIAKLSDWNKVYVKLSGTERVERESYK